MTTITTTHLNIRGGWSGCIKRESEGRVNGRCGGESGEEDGRGDNEERRMRGDERRSGCRKSVF
jgi:hypothetical protein